MTTTHTTRTGIRNRRLSRAGGAAVGVGVLLIAGLLGLETPPAAQASEQVGGSVLSLEADVAFGEATGVGDDVPAEQEGSVSRPDVPLVEVGADERRRDGDSGDPVGLPTPIADPGTSVPVDEPVSAPDTADGPSDGVDMPDGDAGSGNPEPGRDCVDARGVGRGHDEHGAGHGYGHLRHCED